VGGHGIGYSCSLQRKFARMFLSWLFQIAANLLPATSNKGWAVKDSHGHVNCLQASGLHGLWGDN